MVSAGVTATVCFNGHHKTGASRLIRECDTLVANFWMWSKREARKKKREGKGQKTAGDKTHNERALLFFALAKQILWNYYG